MMPDNNADPQTVFIQLVSKTIETNAGLTSKVDNIAKTQERQDSKLDGLLVTLTRIETLNGSLTQRIETSEKLAVDHEARIRTLEPYLSVIREHDKEIDEIKATNKDQADDIIEIEKRLVKYGAYAAVGLVAVQFVLATFVAPWVQSFLGK